MIGKRIYELRYGDAIWLVCLSYCLILFKVRNPPRPQKIKMHGVRPPLHFFIFDFVEISWIAQKKVFEVLHIYSMLRSNEA